MRHWLVKSEPDAFSWEQQARRGTEPWTGVRNHSAKNNLAAMRLDDPVFFYHSNQGREIVGVVTVAREAYPDPSADAGPWVCVDLRAVGPMPRPVGLVELRADPAFAGMVLLRQSRLSVCPIEPADWGHICRLGGWPAKP